MTMEMRSFGDPPSAEYSLVSYVSWTYETVLDTLVDLWEHTGKDTRTDGWAFMDSTLYPLAIVLVYLLGVVLLGTVLMRNREPYDIRVILLSYNVTALTLNFAMGMSLTKLVYDCDYALRCQHVRFRSHDERENEIATWIWVFHLSKIIELVDTMFIILRKRHDHLTFLHVYHHSTIVFASWIGVRFVPGGSTAVIAAVNSWVHVLMYTYYKMTSLGFLGFDVNQIVSYKKFVTIMQLSQFVFTIYICITSLLLGEICGFPTWISAWLLIYMLTFVVLFGNFYITTYYPKVAVADKQPTEFSTLEDKERKKD